MFIRSYSTLLILFYSLIIIAGNNSKSKNIFNDKLFQKQYQKYYIIPYDKCQKLSSKDKTISKICALGYISERFTGSSIKVINGRRGLVSFNIQNSTEEDEYELLCYRCSFGKTSEDECGRYKSIYNNEDWAKKCPVTKD